MFMCRSCLEILSGNVFLLSDCDGGGRHFRGRRVGGRVVECRVVGGCLLEVRLLVQLESVNWYTFEIGKLK